MKKFQYFFFILYFTLTIPILKTVLRVRNPSLPACDNQQMICRKAYSCSTKECHVMFPEYTAMIYMFDIEAEHVSKRMGDPFYFAVANRDAFICSTLNGKFESCDMLQKCIIVFGKDVLRTLWEIILFLVSSM